MEEIKWPGIGFAEGTLTVYTDRPSGCSTVAFCKGRFNGMKIIDQNGNVFCINQVTTNPIVTRLRRFFSWIYNPKLAIINIDYQLESQISLQEFRRIVVETIDAEEKENNFWSEGGSVNVLKREVMSASSFRKVMQILTSPQSIPDEPENSSDGKDNM